MLWGDVGAHLCQCRKTLHLFPFLFVQRLYAVQMNFRISKYQFTLKHLYYLFCENTSIFFNEIELVCFGNRDKRTCSVFVLLFRVNIQFHRMINRGSRKPVYPLRGNAQVVSGIKSDIKSTIYRLTRLK